MRDRAKAGCSRCEELAATLCRVEQRPFKAWVYREYVTFPAVHGRCGRKSPLVMD